MLPSSSSHSSHLPLSLKSLHQSQLFLCVPLLSPWAVNLSSSAPSSSLTPSTTGIIILA